jgi:DNA-binding LacI/PurR family transcriptional regulator
MRSAAAQHRPKGSSTPLTAAVRDRIVHSIDTGEFPAGLPLPSERELSEQLLASRTVIRAAIWELTQVGRLASRPKCRPVVVEPTAVQAEAASIAIRLWPSTSDYIAAQILKGIQKAAPNGTRLVVVNVAGDDWDGQVAAERAFLESLAEDASLSGAILWYIGGEANQNALAQVLGSKLPVVLIDRQAPETCPTDCVGTDNVRSAQKAVDHLVKLGHRRIGLITNQDNASSVRQREDGYQRALADAGIAFDESLMFRDRKDEPEGVDEALDGLLCMPNPPTAIFCVNDHIALQAFESLSNRGIAVPEEMSLIGFDGLLRWIPGGGYLTSMHQDFERMGEIAVDLLAKSSRNSSSVVQHVLLDAPLQEQGSTQRLDPQKQSIFIRQSYAEVNK